jgi:Putative Actinobacterial Holin-X, holin superfamily III
MGILNGALKAGLSNLKESGSDSFELTVDYVKQETVDPLKALGRFLAFGAVGAFMMGLGVLFGLIAVLRILQEETGAFHGNLSWLPYLIVAVLGSGVLALAAWRVVSGPAKRRRPRPTAPEEAK